METVDQDKLWKTVMGELEIEISGGAFAAVFKKSRVLQLTDEKIVIGFINGFIIDKAGPYKENIKRLLAKNGCEPKEIEFKIAAKVVREETEETLLVNAPANPKAAKQAPERQPVPANSLTKSYRQGLNERYTFDNFVVGPGNELAFVTCQAVSRTPGTKYNPLFLYGGSGVGKTHLMQAAGNAYLEAHPDAKVLYVSTEQFIQEFVDAIKYKKTSEVANHYRSADMLIVDDIQFMAGKDRTEEEFFHTFNILHQSSKQIIISSDRPPKDIPTIQDRLKTRFAWGMSIDLQIPDLETRTAIVQSKTEEQGMFMSTEVADYLATRIQTNIRELEGALNQLLAYCEMHGMEPTIDAVKFVLGSGKARPKHLSAKQIIERCARHFQVPVEDLLSPKRDKDIVVPRQVAMYMMRSELHLSFPKIAKELGRKDHTTAIHSVQKITDESSLDADLRNAINQIKEKLYA